MATSYNANEICRSSFKPSPTMTGLAWIGVHHGDLHIGLANHLGEAETAAIEATLLELHPIDRWNDRNSGPFHYSAESLAEGGDRQPLPLPSLLP